MEQHRVAHAGRPMNKSTRTADPLALTLIVLGALLCLGASFTREQIEEVKDIVGTWKGAYAEDGGERVILIISENGAYGGRAGKAPLKGTLRIFSGNLEYQETGSQRITFSLYERGKQRLLRGFDEAGEFKLSLKLVKRRAKPGTLALEDTRFITIAATAAPTSDPKASSAEAQAGEWTINYCKDLTVDEFHKAAKWAFNNRKFVIEEDTPSSLTGALQGKKVEIAMTAPGHIVIRWVPGFGYHKDNWLKNVRYDVLWGLAGEAEQGKWTINWCKDLTVDKFHKAAKWALQKRKYGRVGRKYPISSLTGARQGKKIEIAMTAPGHIVISWVPGFGYHKDNWLKNLWRDVSVALAL